MVHDGLTCAFDQVHMAVHGSTAAKKYHISRDEQDHYALLSQKRAAEAAEAGKLREEIVPVTWTGKKGKQHTVEADEGRVLIRALSGLRRSSQFLQPTERLQPETLPV